MKKIITVLTVGLLFAVKVHAASWIAAGSSKSFIQGIMEWWNSW